MNKILLMIQNEIYRVTARRSFLFTLFLVPLITFTVIIFVSSSNDPNRNNPVSQALAPALAQTTVEGYVDQSGLIQELPADVTDRLRPFSDEAAAAEALRAGAILDFYVLPPDFVETGKVKLVQTDFSPWGQAVQSDTLRYAIDYNLLKGGPESSRFENPIAQLETQVLTEKTPRDSGNSLTFFLPYAVGMVFYFVIFGSASLMLNNITDEKKNRMIEILMTSVTPLQMLTGKMIALGIVGLAQTVVWVGMGMALTRVSGRALSLPASFQLPTSLLIWGVVFFLLGYAVYASLMAGIGALVPSLREASQATLVIMLPVLIPLMMTGAMTEAPNGPVSVALSLFPLTAPVAMMSRLAASSSVPAWQPLLAAILLAGTAVIVVRSVAGMFRAQNLLSGRAFSLRVFFLALLGRV